MQYLLLSNNELWKQKPRYDYLVAHRMTHTSKSYSIINHVTLRTVCHNKRIVFIKEVV